MSRWRLIVGLVVAVGLGVAVVVFLRLDNPPDPQIPVVGGPAVTTSSTSTTESAQSPPSTIEQALPTPAATAVTESASWVRVDDENGLGGPDHQRMSSVAVGGPGLAAVGDFWRDVDGNPHVAVWTSSDGLAWSRVPLDAALIGPGAQVMVSVVAGGPGLVAVGADALGAGHRVAAVWTSPDGISWTRVAHDEAIFGAGSQSMSRVVAGGPGLVAFGSDESGGDRDVAVWTSPDGLVWSRVAHDEAVFGGPNTQEISGVVAGGPGLVAVGSDGPDGDLDAAVWTSSDGLVWARVPYDQPVFGGPNRQYMCDVVAFGPGLVAVGSDGPDGDLDAAVWTSSDGLVWSRVPHDEPVFGGPNSQEITSVVAGGPGLVAVGYDGTFDGRDAAVWTSPDGISWTRVPNDEAIFGGPGAQPMLSVVPFGPGLVAVGYDSSSGDLDAAVWVLPTK